MKWLNKLSTVFLVITVIGGVYLIGVYLPNQLTGDVVGLLNLKSAYTILGYALADEDVRADVYRLFTLDPNKAGNDVSIEGHTSKITITLLPIDYDLQENTEFSIYHALQAFVDTYNESMVQHLKDRTKL